MSRYTHRNNSRVLGFLTLCMLFSNAGMAQPISRMSAFTTCINAAGDAFLCTLESWDLASGFSAGERGDSASLVVGSLSQEEQEEECGQTLIPFSLEIGLTNPNLKPGDRIYLEDFTIEAIDENGNFIPEVPIVVYVLSQEGMLEISSNEDYVEVISFGRAEFFTENYCGNTLGRPGASASFSLTVTL